MSKTPEEIAEFLYEKYCDYVGGTAYDGSLLPNWLTFQADSNKAKQANAWRCVAQALLEEESNAKSVAEAWVGERRGYAYDPNKATDKYGKSAFLAGYKAAQSIVEEELQAVQAQRVEHPGLGSAEYALKNVLAKMGRK
jgi:hypothetical protein